MCIFHLYFVHSIGQCLRGEGGVQEEGDVSAPGPNDLFSARRTKITERTWAAATSSS